MSNMVVQMSSTAACDSVQEGLQKTYTEVTSLVQNMARELAALKAEKLEKEKQPEKVESETPEEKTESNDV